MRREITLNAPWTAPKSCCPSSPSCCSPPQRLLDFRTSSTHWPVSQLEPSGTTKKLIWQIREREKSRNKQFSEKYKVQKNFENFERKFCCQFLYHLVELVHRVPVVSDLLHQQRLHPLIEKAMGETLELDAQEFVGRIDLKLWENSKFFGLRVAKIKRKPVICLTTVFIMPSPWVLMELTTCWTRTMFSCDFPYPLRSMKNWKNWSKNWFLSM